MKKCPSCGETKPFEDFSIASARKDGRASTCKVCKREIDKKYHSKSYEEKIRPRRRTAEYRLKNLSWVYGISVEQISSMMEICQGLCEICQESPATCIDHDHNCCVGQKSCGQCVRGMLCKSCNWGLGQMKDSPERLRAAAEYIESFGAK